MILVIDPQNQIKNPIKTNHVNVIGTLNILQACLNTSVKKIIFGSSSSIYGTVQYLPFDEDHPKNPISPYGVSKLAAEHLCNLYRTNYGIPTVSLRFFTVYGPRQRPDMAFNKFIRAILSGEKIKIYSDGEQTRDFTFISDIVEGIVKAFEYLGGFQIFNLGFGKPVKIKELLRILENLCGKKAVYEYRPRQPGDVDITYADISKAKQILGFQPK